MFIERDLNGLQRGIIASGVVAFSLVKPAIERDLVDKDVLAAIRTTPTGSIEVGL